MGDGGDGMGMTTGRNHHRMTGELPNVEEARQMTCHWIMVDMVEGT